MNENLLLIAAVVFVAFLVLRSFAARREIERQAAEETARREAEQLAVAEVARREAERQAAEETARREAERQAAEETARREAERQVAEETARREAERQAAEEVARREVERLAAEEMARREAERQVAEETARREVERQAADEVLREEAENAQRGVPDAAVPATGLKAKLPEQTVVMVADDSKVVRVKTGRLLTAHNYQVLTADDGLDAARQIERSAPDVLITDVDMPGMGGLELVRQLRASPRTAHLPIIMVTSANDVLQSEALASGANVVLGKPYPEEQLIAHIQRFMMMGNGG